MFIVLKKIETEKSLHLDEHNRNTIGDVFKIKDTAINLSNIVEVEDDKVLMSRMTQYNSPLELRKGPITRIEKNTGEVVYVLAKASTILEKLKVAKQLLKG